MSGHLDKFNLTASNSFGVTLTETYRTAAFGGDALTIENGNDLGLNNNGPTGMA